MMNHRLIEERKAQERNERIRKNLHLWAERVTMRMSFRGQNLRPFDVLHDLRGILNDDEHFLPRL